MLLALPCLQFTFAWTSTHFFWSWGLVKWTPGSLCFLNPVMAAKGRQQQLLAGCKFETTVALNPSWVGFFFFFSSFYQKGTLGCSSPSPFICAVKRGGICEQPLGRLPLAAARAPGLFKECVWSQACEQSCGSLVCFSFAGPFISVIASTSCPSPALSAAVCEWEALCTSGPSSSLPL